MTSLQIPISGNSALPTRVPDEIKEWGTGKLKREFSLWLPKSPTWHVTGKQEKSKYDLTSLKLSKVRLSDQLLTNPEHSKMSGIMINKNYPAEHPMASHQSRFAVFPNFESADDPRTGNKARAADIKDPEMAANNWNIGVIKKIKGYGYRHEVQQIIPESLKKPLTWNSSDNTNQVVKSPWSDKQTFYPTAPKTFHATAPVRSDEKCLSGNMRVNERSANVMRNLQKDHRASIYQRSYTGLGESHRMNVENLDQQKERKLQTGYDNFELKPKSIAVFDPTRPLDGRLEVTIEPKELKNADVYNHPDPEITFGRALTAKEKHEHHLWYGKRYASLPEGYATPRDGIIKYHPLPTKPSTYPYAGSQEVTSASQIEQEVRQRQQQAKLQQVHAEGRYNLLDSQKADHDIASLRRKMALTAGDKEQPDTFYSHESKYQKQRAGLYRTSYIPEKLAAVLDPKRYAELIHSRDTHLTALTNNEGAKLDSSMTAVGQHGRTLAGSVPQYKDMATPADVHNPWKDTVESQKKCLQPDIYNADIRNQEGVLINKETTYGENYNTKTFLQQRQLLDRCRDEPMIVMSQQNRSLTNAITPTLDRDNIPVPQVIEEPPQGYPGYVNRLVHRPYTAPQKALPVAKPVNPTPSVNYANPRVVCSQKPADVSSLPVPLRQQQSLYVEPKEKEVPEEFTLVRNDDSTFVKQQEKERINREWKFGIYRFDYGSKDHDPRFSFKAGAGVPQPTCDLGRLYNSFSKTDACRKHYRKHAEKHPDLRENHIHGKRHSYDGMHIQVNR